MQLLTIREAAEQLRLSPRSLNNKHYRERIDLPVVKIGASVRILEADLAQWVHRHREVTQDEGRE